MLTLSFRQLGDVAMAATALIALTLTSMPASASQTVQRFNQAEQRDSSGRLIVEASLVSVVNCNAVGENGGQFYIYQYVKRQGFRAVRPPNWGQPIGGRDWPSFADAVATACGGGTGGNCSATGTWRQTTADVGTTDWVISSNGQAKESSSGILAPVTMSGRTMRISWTAPSGFAGIYEWTLDASCANGSGSLIFTKGGSGTHKSTIRRML